MVGKLKARDLLYEMFDVITVILVSVDMRHWSVSRLQHSRRRGRYAVGPQVFPHVTRLYEGLGTNWAGVFPLSGVSGRVASQVGLLHEGLPTVLADKLLLA